MGMESHYEPCFTSIPQAAEARWTLLREFVGRWHNLNLPLSRDPERVAREIEYTLNRTLPDSIREWVALAHDLTELDAFEDVFRDSFKVSRMNRLSATTLLLAGEGDVFWAIDDQYAELPDPPVDCIQRDGPGQRWTRGWRESDSLTSFALGHMAYFLGSGYVRRIDAATIAELERAFPVVADFDGLRILEMTDLICFVRERASAQPTLIVAHQPALPKAELPECIRRLIPT
jgi:hypothetical protein